MICRNNYRSAKIYTTKERKIALLIQLMVNQPKKASQFFEFIGGELLPYLEQNTVLHHSR
jgi:hypothetical protein